MTKIKTELHNSTWVSCDELKGGIDASQYNRDESVKNG